MYEPKVKNSITERVMFTGVVVPETASTYDAQTESNESPAPEGRVLRLDNRRSPRPNEEQNPPWNR